MYRCIQLITLRPACCVNAHFKSCVGLKSPTSVQHLQAQVGDGLEAIAQLQQRLASSSAAQAHSSSTAGSNSSQHPGAAHAQQGNSNRMSNASRPSQGPLMAYSASAPSGCGCWIRRCICCHVMSASSLSGEQIPWACQAGAEAWRDDGCQLCISSCRAIQGCCEGASGGHLWQLPHFLLGSGNRHLQQLPDALLAVGNRHRLVICS